MKKRVVLVLMAAMLVVGVTACGSKDAGKKEEAKTEQKATGEIGTVSIDDLNTTDTQVIDIREEEQYIGWETEDGKGGHIKGAIDFPESWLDMDIENDAAIGTTMENEIERRGLDLDKATVLYSNQDVSEEDAQKYQKLGFKNISVLEGGYDAYVEAATASLVGFARRV